MNHISTTKVSMGVNEFNYCFKGFYFFNWLEIYLLKLQIYMRLQRVECKIQILFLMYKVVYINHTKIF
jgi:hypothetical protein